MKNDEIKNFYMAVILSIALIFVTNYFFFKYDIVPSQKKSDNVSVDEHIVENNEDKKEETVFSLEDVLNQSPQIFVENNALAGSIRTKGARIDNIQLKKYKQTLDKDSKNIELYSPAKTENPYYAEFGWLSGNKNIKLPTSDTLWTVKGKKLTTQTPIILEWNNGDGLRFITKISLDENYMFNIEQNVENNTDKNIILYPYGMIARHRNTTDTNNIVYEGLIGVINDKLEEVKYKDLAKENKQFETHGGWIGFSDRYWFSAIILDKQIKNKIKFSRNNETVYQTDFVGDSVSIAAGSIGSSKNILYVGAKEIKLLDKYNKDSNIHKFDLAVDFGWYYFLTKPFFYILDFLYRIIGNMGWAILLFAALLRLAMFPIANKSYESMAKMKKVQPKLKELQEKYADDKVKIQQETMALYSQEKINPAAGCLPLFIQIPVFFSLYKVLNISIEIRHAPFIGWIKDLSAPDPLTISVMTGFSYIPSILDIGFWPIVMGLTMYLQQKLNPAPANKDQARMFALLPFIFTFMMGHFASGLVIYWTLSNILSLIQQKVIARKTE
jgi:YidC/Oxa1 family membrane protein insertase